MDNINIYMSTELISEQILDEEIFLDSSDINDEINDILTIKLKDTTIINYNL